MSSWVWMVALSGCDSDTCVADCNAGTIEGSSSDTSGAPLACQEATDVAAAWIEDNHGCTYLTDCKQLDGFCFQGPGRGTCGSVPLHVSADPAEWDALHDALVGCDCGAAACGEAVTCSAEGRCVGIGPLGDICPDVATDAAAFVAANRECTTDQDCMLVTADCYMGPEQTCRDIALNQDADTAAWARLNTMVGECGGTCGGSACGATARCGADGQCSATVP